MMKDASALKFKEGEILLIDKPYKWSSFDVVRKVKHLTKAKVGHSGTLDPLATGLLLIATGPFTKKLTQLQGLPKEYTGTFCIGAITPTYDRESNPEQETSIEHLTEADFERAKEALTGEIEQVPPVFSAVKIDGVRSYKLARKGEAPAPEPRQVQISKFEITKVELPLVYFRVRCSKGTYIRSLAHDFGQLLGVGAYLYDLRRTMIGDYHVDDAWDMEELSRQLKELKQQRNNEE